SEDAFDVMDTGRSRNAADVLGIHGYPSQNAVAAAARGLMFIERYGRVFPSQRDSHLYVTPVTTLQYVKEHPEIIDGVHLGDRGGSCRGVLCGPYEPNQGEWRLSTRHSDGSGGSGARCSLPVTPDGDC